MTIEYKDSKRIVTYPTEYKVHTFTSSGTFAVTGSGNIEYLVVAGGGGGAGSDATPAGSGGGAGGLRTNVSGATSGGNSSAEATYGVTTQNYTITIGSGGSGGGTAGDGENGTDGNDSSIAPASGTTITSIGGGGGGAYYTSGGRSGGSGGGTAWATWSGTAGGAGTSGQGFAGGNNPDSSSGSLQGGSGGGGAGALGANGGGNGGNGGIGLQSSINGTTTYYAGGGAGALGNSTGSNGTAGSGSIGQGGNGSANSGSGTAGANGIVIVRYDSNSSITATGGTITTVTGGEQSKPTNVQDNSILVEKDTARRYWFDADPTATTETVFDATTQSAVSTAFCYSGYAFSGTRFGTRIDAGFSGIGKYIKKIMLPLDKTGSPTGNCWYAVFDSSNVEKARTNTKDVSTLPTTSSAGNAEDTELTLESAVKLEAGDIVAFVYEGGSSGNYPQTYSASNTLIANTTPMKYPSNSWSYRPDRNIWFKFDSDPASITLPATWTYEPNANSSPLFDTHNGTSSSHSTTITVASNDNRLLIAHVAHSSNLGNAATTVTSVTSNVSGAFTQLMTQNSDATANNKTDVWYLKAPATGAHTVTVVYSHTTVSRSIALTSLYNVDQTTPINLSSKAGNGASTGTPITVDITPTVKNSVLMALCQAQYSQNTPSDTSIYMATYAGGGDFSISAQKKLSPTRGSVNTMSWVKNSALAWSTVAFEVIGV